MLYVGYIYVYMMWAWVRKGRQKTRNTHDEIHRRVTVLLKKLEGHSPISLPSAPRPYWMSLACVPECP